MTSEAPSPPLLPGETEVSVIMTRNLTTVEPTRALTELLALFAAISFHHVPVTQAGELVGILSDRDISKALANHETIESTTAADIMSPEPIVVDLKTSIETASILLLENQISCLPVIDETEALVGILTWKDLLRFFVYYQ